MGELPWDQIGPGALVAFFVILVFTGKLVPRSFLTDSKEREKEWRTLALKSQQQNGELIAQVREMAVSGQASQAVMKAVTELANERQQVVEPKDLTT